MKKRRRKTGEKRRTWRSYISRNENVVESFTRNSRRREKRTTSIVNANYCWSEILYIIRASVYENGRNFRAASSQHGRQNRLPREYNASEQRFNSNTPRRFVLLCYGVKLMKTRQRRVRYNIV